ncbi:MAG: LysE family transporter [Rhodocyclaceae bacterium]
MSIETWIAFFAASWLISLSPGPGAISCMAAGMRYGYRAGLWNILGLQLGIVLLVAIVAVGLGALLAASTLAFAAVKWLGVAYLIWLGIQQWRAVPTAVAPAQEDARRPRELLLRGFLINASNPKGIVFMAAVLPQFIDPAASQWPQYAAAAATLVVTDLVVMSGYTLLASRLLGALRNPTHVRRSQKLFGAGFVGAGLLLAGFRRQ